MEDVDRIPSEAEIDDETDVEGFDRMSDYVIAIRVAYRRSCTFLVSGR